MKALILLSYLPFRILYILSDITFLLVCYIFKYRRTVIEKNINIAFPDKSTEEKLKIIKGFYKNFCDVIFETIKAITISHEEMVRRVTYSNIEALDEAKHRGLSAVYLATHNCNWEYMLLSGSIRFPYQVYGVYKPLNDKKLDEFLLKVRSRFGGILVPSDQIIRNIAKHKEEVRGIGLIGDQRPHIGNRNKLWVKMFGHDTAYHAGLETVPRLEKAAVFIAKMVRKKRGYYHIDIVKLKEPPFSNELNSTEIIEMYTRLLEQLINENPSDWLWSHDRWKDTYEEAILWNRKK